MSARTHIPTRSAAARISARKPNHMASRLPTLLGAAALVAALPVVLLPVIRAARSSKVQAASAAQMGQMVQGTSLATSAAPAATSVTLALPAAAVPAGVVVEPLYSRERIVGVESVNTGETATFRIGPRGYVRAEHLAAIEHFFRCRRTDREAAIAPGVLVVLADIAERWPGHVIEVVSGYRAPPFGVPHSRHFKGHAIDLRVRGVRTAAVRDFVWREHRGVGVGFYSEGDFLHVDWRPDEHEIAWSAREEAATPEYNPRWAKRARRGLPVRRVDAGAELALATMDARGFMP